MKIPNKTLTVEEYEAFVEENPDGLYELIHGRLVEKVPSQLHTKG